MITETGIAVLKSLVGRSLSDFHDAACDIMGAERYLRFISVGDVGQEDVVREAERLRRQEEEDAGKCEQHEMFLGVDAAAQCRT